MDESVHLDDLRVGASSLARTKMRLGAKVCSSGAAGVAGFLVCVCASVCVSACVSACVSVFVCVAAHLCPRVCARTQGA